jgi:hypothetical protein
MIDAFDDREHDAASHALTSLMPAGGPEGKKAVGLVAARTNAPYRKVGAFPFATNVPANASLRNAPPRGL